MRSGLPEDEATLQRISSAGGPGAELLVNALKATDKSRFDHLAAFANLIQERIADASNAQTIMEAEAALREAILLSGDDQPLRHRLGSLLFRRTALHQEANAWSEAAKSAWKLQASLPDMFDFGADVVALAERMERQALACARTDPILAANLALAAWALAGRQRGFYRTARSLFVHLGTGELGKSVDAATFETALASDPQDIISLIGLSNLRRRTGELDAAEALCRQALQYWPSNPFAEGRLASILAEEGRLHAADGLFSRIGATYGGVEAAIRLAPEFINTVCASQSAEDGALGLEPLPKDAMVVFAGGDAVYFHRFADALANSLAKNGRGVALHLHVVDPDQAVEERMRAMRERLRNLPLRLTVERMPSGIAEEQRRTYYACARFIHLPRILASYALPLLLLDIDTVVLKDVTPLRAAFELERADVALVAGKTKDPWCSLWADTILFAPSPRGLGYARKVRDYIRHFLARSEAAWFLDQIALYAVWVAGFRDEPQPKMITLPTDIQNTTTSRAYFWSLHMSQPTNADAPAHPFYRQYQQNTA